MRVLLPLDSRPCGTELDPVGVESWYSAKRDVGLRLNMVTSIDGAVTMSGRSGGLGSPADKEVFATLRALADVVLVGAGTVRAEHYGPVKLREDRVRRRLERGQKALPRLAIVTGTGDLDPDGAAFRDPDASGNRPIVLTTKAATEERVAALRQVSTVEVLGDDHVDVAAAVLLFEERGWRRILCEGGPSLTNQLWLLADELCLTQSPVIVGASELSIASTPLENPVRFELSGMLEDSGVLFSRYSILSRRANP